MKQAILILIIFVASLIALALTGCSRRTVTSQSTSEIKDSVHVEYRDRPVEVKIPGDTVRLIERIECDEKTNKPKPLSVKKKSGRASVNLKVNSVGQLVAVGICDSLNLVINAKDKEISRLRTEIKTLREQTHTVEFKTRKIDIFCRWFSLIIVLLLIAYTYLRIKRIL